MTEALLPSGGGTMATASRGGENQHTRAHDLAHVENVLTCTLSVVTEGDMALLESIPLSFRDHV